MQVRLLHKPTKVDLVTKGIKHGVGLLLKIMEGPVGPKEWGWHCRLSTARGSHAASSSGNHLYVDEQDTLTMIDVSPKGYTTLPKASK